MRTKKKRCQSFFCRIDLDPPPPRTKIPGSAHESSLSGAAWKKKTKRSCLEKVDIAHEQNGNGRQTRSSVEKEDIVENYGKGRHSGTA